MATPEMTLLWFIIWFFANDIGSPEPIVIGGFGPVNGWAGTLLFAISIDLSIKIFWRN